ncbi:MAG: hypothetical protein US42_C0007G0037 [Candidatus Magasanikbacteria bacterium GW2011_GWC2_37_14]|uniref:Peptidase C39-like domain-containing protein n=1 Tax=Candidatus Magasanikbacteria bacterium GW2011_GWC2_37_14 TaxID=1619046 RepID=A0A0G0JHT5_9BACT|nr:MAG: hypothetical protein US42_C0007G0037 [Candidatus Magasanikbacteria bacterium GW2011_GWC2_37_14]
MKSKYTILNTICLILSGCFLVGTIYIFGKMFVNDEIIINYETVSSDSKQQITDSSEDIKALTPESITSTVKITEARDSLPPRQASSTSGTEVGNDSTILPKEFILNVPFTSQAPEKNWEQPWQDACEEAALLMLDAYYKGYNLSPIFSRDEILKMVKWEEDKGWGLSIPIVDIKQMTEEYFHLNLVGQIKIIENPTVDDIKKFIANNKPVLVVANGKVLPNPNFRNGGPIYHALIIKGYDEENFITNDPGTQFGKDFKYKYQDLMNAIHDWNNGDVKNGRKVILVVE